MGAESKETFCLVIRSQDHGESDRILTLFSHDHGRCTAIAKGANKSQKRFVNKLEIFSFLKIYYKEPRPGALFFLEEAELHNSFLPLRRSYLNYCCGSVILEAILAGIPEHEPDSNLFSLMLWALHTIEKSKDPRKPVTLFLIRFFNLLGYRPHFSCCTSCGTETQSSSEFSFDPDTGGLLCQSCSGLTEYNKNRISHGTIRLIEDSSDKPLQQLERTGISLLQIQEVTKIFLEYGRQLFQKELSSWKLFNQLSGL